MLMSPPRDTRTFYGGRLVTEPVEVPDTEAAAFAKYGWTAVETEEAPEKEPEQEEFKE